MDRSFLYRHHDLPGKIHVIAVAPPAGGAGGAQVTRASLQAGLLAAHERACRLSTRIQQLERRLPQVPGEQVFRESGLGEPAGIARLQHQITHLQQQAADLKLQLEDRDREPEAARTANRELMAQVKHVQAAAPGNRRHAAPGSCTTPAVHASGFSSAAELGVRAGPEHSRPGSPGEQAADDLGLGLSFFGAALGVGAGGRVGS